MVSYSEVSRSKLCIQFSFPMRATFANHLSSSSATAMPPQEFRYDVNFNKKLYIGMI